MNKTLILLVLVLIILAWNFIFTDKQLDLTDQAKVLQGLSTAISHKTAVEKYWSEQGRLPDHDDWASVTPAVSVDLSQTIVQSIEVGRDGPGVISVFYTARPGLESPELIEGEKINLIPAARNGRLDWTCEGTLEPALLPRNCSLPAVKTRPGNQ